MLSNLSPIQSMTKDIRILKHNIRTTKRCILRKKIISIALYFPSNVTVKEIREKKSRKKMRKYSLKHPLGSEIPSLVPCH